MRESLRRLLPEPATATFEPALDAFEAYGDVPRRWLRIGMVMSADGSVTDEEGWSDGLGGAADLEVFRTLRALADAVLVGAGTVRTGRLGPARLRADLRARRGRPPAPIVVVSRSLDLDWSQPLFTAAETPTLVVTTAAAAAAAPDPGVRLVLAGEESLDLGLAVTLLREEHGLEHLLCEGGPALAASVVRAGLADELCLNVAPALLGGGPGHTPLLGALAGRVRAGLSAVYADDGVLFLRYRL